MCINCICRKEFQMFSVFFFFTKRIVVRKRNKNNKKTHDFSEIINLYTNNGHTHTPFEHRVVYIYYYSEWNICNTVIFSSLLCVKYVAKCVNYKTRQLLHM